MDNWIIVIIHTRPQSALKTAFEKAFPKGRVFSLFRPSLENSNKFDLPGEELLQKFRQRVYDPGIWKQHRVLTVYETGYYHHWTYALSRFAADRLDLARPRRHNWTYFHFDNHRDDYDDPAREMLGYSPYVNFANFVDSLAYDHGAIPFLVGPDVEPRYDRDGYLIRGFRIPIYSNYFTGPLRQLYYNRRHPLRNIFGGNEMPSVEDLRETPRNAYLSFDLDVLTPKEIVTDFDQNPYMTLRKLCAIVDRVKQHKYIFGADILGLPQEIDHPLSVLTQVILARKVLGLGVEDLLQHHTAAKRRQAAWIGNNRRFLMDPERTSPLSMGQLLEIVR